MVDDVEVLARLVSDRVEAFERTQDPALLLEDIVTHQASALLLAMDAAGSVRPAMVLALAMLHLHRYHVLPPGQDGDDLDLAMRLFHTMLPHTPHLIPVGVRHFMAQHLTGPDDLFALGFQARIDARLRHHGDFDHALALLRRAAAPDHQIRPVALAGVSVVLTERYELTGRQEDLDEAVEVGRAAVDLTPSDHPARALHLSNLGVSLRSRFHRTRSERDLDEAVACGEAAALAATDGDRKAMFLAMFALTLRARGEHRGSLDDLNRAVWALESALRHTKVLDGPEAGKRRSNLRSVLLSRYQLGHDLADLDRIVSGARVHVEQARQAGLPVAEPLAELAEALSTRHGADGDPAALDEAISICRDLLDIDPAAKTAHLITLQSLLRDRFHWYGDLADLDQAIAAGEQVLADTPVDSIDRASVLSAVGSALRERFTVGAERTDIVRAVLLLREANTQPYLRWSDRLAYQNNLAGALYALNGLEQRGEHLEEAVDLARQALVGTAPNDPHLAARYVNLSHLLLSQWHSTADRTRLQEAVRLSQECLGKLRPLDPTRLGAHLTLARTHRECLRNATTATDAVSQAGAAMTQFRLAAAASTAPASQRLDAAREWATFATGRKDWPASLSAYTTASGLLPIVAWRGLKRSGRQRLMEQADWGIGTAGCATALMAGQPEAAMKIIEQSRGVSWSQVLDIRSDLSALRNAAPDLARRLDQVRQAITVLDLQEGPA